MDVDSVLTRPCLAFETISAALPTYILSEDSPDGHAVVLMKVRCCAGRCRAVWLASAIASTAMGAAACLLLHLRAAAAAAASNAPAVLPHCAGARLQVGGIKGLCDAVFNPPPGVHLAHTRTHMQRLAEPAAAAQLCMRLRRLAMRMHMRTHSAIALRRHNGVCALAGTAAVSLQDVEHTLALLNEYLVKVAAPKPLPAGFQVTLLRVAFVRACRACGMPCMCMCAARPGGAPGLRAVFPDPAVR